MVKKKKGEQSRQVGKRARLFVSITSVCFTTTVYTGMLWFSLYIYIYLVCIDVLTLSGNDVRPYRAAYTR